MTGLVDLPFEVEDARAFAFRSDESHLVEGGPQVGDRCHVFQVHVGELFAVLPLEDCLLVEVVSSPEELHDLLVGHANGVKFGVFVHLFRDGMEHFSHFGHPQCCLDVVEEPVKPTWQLKEGSRDSQGLAQGMQFSCLSLVLVLLETLQQS